MMTLYINHYTPSITIINLLPNLYHNPHHCCNSNKLIMHPHRPSTSCNRHPEEKFTGICPKCLYERLAILEQKSSSSVYKAPTSSTVITAHKPKLFRSRSFPPFKNEGLSRVFEKQRKSCKAHRPSTTSCDRHPKEEFTGICPKCLFERLAILEKKSSSSISNAPSSSSIIVPHKPIFQPKLFRSTSFPTFKNEGLSRAFLKQRKLCNVKTCNFSSSFVVQEDEEDNIVVHDVIEVKESPKPQPEPQVTYIQHRVQEIVEEEPERELKVDVEAEETLQAMKDPMEMDSQVKKSSSQDLKGCFWFVASIFKKKRKIKKHE